MWEKKLGLAFVGCGRVANWQAIFFEKGIDGVKVAVTCDPVESKAKEMAARLGAESMLDYQSVLKRDDVDIVSIMSESGKHYQHAKQALEAGKHVIVEKPPCMFAEQVIELGELAEQKGLMFAPIFQNRYNPAMKVLKSAYDEGRFGKLVCVSVRLFWCRYQDYYEDGWHGTWEMDGGVVNQQAIHHVDAMQWVCGKVDEIVAMQGNQLNQLEAEDTTVALVKFKNGALGTVEVTTAARPEDMDASLTLIGEKGSVTIGGVALNEVSQWKFIESKDGDEDVKSRCSVDVPNGYGYSHGSLLQDIINRIRHDNLQSPISPTSTAETVKLIHTIYRSAEDGACVQVKNNLRSRLLGRNTKGNSKWAN